MIIVIREVGDDERLNFQWLERERVKSKGTNYVFIDNERVNYTKSLTLLVKSRRAYIA